MPKKRILLVDDQESVTRTLKLYLEGTGAFEIETENRGARAVETARRFRPDAIVLDIVMPDADGAAVAEELAGDAALREIPIIFLTALVSEQELRSQGRSIGSHTFLAKPVEPDLLIEHIEERLAAKERGAERDPEDGNGPRPG